MNIQHRITGDVFFVTDTVVDWVDVFTPTLARVCDPCQYRKKDKETFPVIRNMCIK